MKKIKELLFFLVLSSALICTIFMSSCANQGVGPSGGPRDSIPPVVVGSIPTPGQTMFSGKEISVTFNEYIAPDNLSEKLVISPPLAKKPEIRTSGKSIIIKIAEDLIPDRTYSVDFKDGIKDYNEGNKLEKLRMVFSTGTRLDTLRIGGYILDAYTLVPVKNVLATLYTFDNDSVFQNLRPDFIARTNDEGYFLFDNLPPDHYKLYGLTDEDKNLYYSQATESIAFTDSMISPSAKFIARTDTVVTGKDTVISKGYNEYSPINMTLLLFQEKFYSQFIVSLKREYRDKCLIVFNEPVADSLKVELLDSLFKGSWNEIEFNENRDSVSLFFTDSTLVNNDTVLFRINYLALDSTGNWFNKRDTLKMIFNKTEKTKTKKKENLQATENFFNFSSNLISSNFDLNKEIILEAPSPIEKMSKEMIGIKEMINDTTQKTINFDLKPVKGTQRKYILLFPLSENTKYQLTIDSAAVKTRTGIPNSEFKTKFSTQKSDYYGSIILSISGLQGKGRLQLLKNNEKEDIVREMRFDSTQNKVIFDFLKPEKYIIKFISDLNDNGKWDTGNLSLNRLPEPVFYFQKVINVKSNWEIKETWEFNSGIKPKKIVDETKEEKKSGKNL